MRGLRRRRDEEPDEVDYADPGYRGAGSAGRGLPYSRWRANGWSVLPMRLFLAALFGFAGYAKLTYPRFFDPASPNGFSSAVAAAKDNTPLGGLLNPLADHPSVYGHLTAYAEIAIGLGLLVGLLIRLAALGGMVLTTMILLSIDWGGVKEYTGSSGWFTAVDLVIAVALSVFLLGGPGPLALDNLFVRARERQRVRDDAEPSFRDSEIEDSRRRLQGEPVAAGAGASAVPAGASVAGAATTRLPDGDRRVPDSEASRVPAEDARPTQLPDDETRPVRVPDDSRPAQVPDDSHPARIPDDSRPARLPDDETRPTRVSDGDAPTTEMPVAPPAEGRPGASSTEDGYPSTGGGRGYADRAGQFDDEEYRDDPEPEPNSLWTQGRRATPPAEPRRDG